MAPYCCVEGCCYSTCKKERDVLVSFHCVPVKKDVRSSWMRVLTKFNPAFEANDFSAVCSLHFTPANFKQNTKKRLLLPNAVPSIFPRYPKSVDSLCKQPRQITNKNSSGKGNTSSEMTIAVIEKRIPHENNSSDNFQMDEFNDSVCGSEKSIGIQVSILPTGRLEMLKKENNILRSQNQRLKEHLKTVTEKISTSKLKFESNTEYHKIKKIKDTLQSNDCKANFLLDQINNFDKHQPHWSDSTLQECLDWRSEASKSYDYVRNNELISLPSRCTLERHVKNKYPGQNLSKGQETKQIVHTIVINEPPFGKVIDQPVSTKLLKNTPKLYTSRNLNIPCYETVSEGLLHAFVVQNIVHTNFVDSTGANNDQDVMTKPINLIDIDINVPFMNKNTLEVISASECNLSLETIVAKNDSIDDISHIEISTHYDQSSMN